MKRADALAVLALLVSACATQRSVQVRAATATGQAVAGATVSWVCTPSGDAGAVTGADGVATANLFNSKPERCTVTISRPGYHTRQLVLESLAAPLAVELQETAP